VNVVNVSKEAESNSFMSRIKE